jgi:serine/threonine-protein kinase RsbW
MIQPVQPPARRGAASVLRVAAEPDILATIRRFVEREAIARGANQTAAWDIVQAIDEAATNIVAHGYRGAGGPMEVEVGKDHGALVVRLRDRAPPFDPTRVPPPDLAQPLEARPIGGMGIHLVRQLTDIVRYSVPEGWNNELTLIKRIESARHGGG